MDRKAVCIGINDYPGTRMDLRGCVNDARDWSGTLAARGFDVKTLLDADARKEAIVETIGRLVSDARRGDSLVITFSGHGTYVPDTNDEEADGLDEALCPYDINEGHALVDDEIHRIFAARAEGVKLLLISDSCHSGTVTRASAVARDPAKAWARFLPLGAWLPAERLPRASSGAPRDVVELDDATSAWTAALEGDDLLLAGCEEGPDRYSYDASFNGRFNGAFSFYALKALKELPADATYLDWHAAIRRYLPSGSHNQKPQIFGSAKARGASIFG